MKWTKVTLETTTEAVDLISDMLSDLGIEGIEIIDNIPITEQERKQLYIDFLPELGEDDGTAQISFYIDPNEDIELLKLSIIDGVKALSEFISVGSGIIHVSETEDKDWINNWKQFFKPFRIDDTIVIKPTWEEWKDSNEKDLVIEIDPGTSFGTGSHETTKLCILSLKKYLKSDSCVLDAGSGSGILSIIAKKLGAKEVVGVDIDPIATDAAMENAKVNRLPAIKIFHHEDMIEVTSNKEDILPKNIHDKSRELSFITGNIIENEEIRNHIGKKKYDVVVANILADVIIPLSDIIGESMKPGGIFISSGIINTKEDAVRQALLKNKFKILEVNRMGDWVSFVVKTEE